MTSATFKSALRDLREDLERLHDDLEAAIDSIVGVDAHAVEDGIITKEDDGSSLSTWRSSRSLFESLDDAAEAAADAFRRFDREVGRVWRRFKLALVHSQATS